MQNQFLQYDEGAYRTCLERIYLYLFNITENFPKNWPGNKLEIKSRFRLNPTVMKNLLHQKNVVKKGIFLMRGQNPGGRSLKHLKK